jgi:ATP-dependent protease ClpP protease subunit
MSLCISDAIRYSQAETRGLVVADAQSAGFRILQACDRRLAYPWARFQFHAPALGGCRIDSDRWEQSIKETQYAHEEQLEVYARRSGQSIRLCRKWAKEEKSFYAPEALELGFIDEIVRPPKK